MVIGGAGGLIVAIVEKTSQDDSYEYAAAGAALVTPLAYAIEEPRARPPVAAVYLGAAAELTGHFILHTPEPATTAAAASIALLGFIGAKASDPSTFLGRKVRRIFMRRSSSPSSVTHG